MKAEGEGQGEGGHEPDSHNSHNSHLPHPCLSVSTRRARARHGRSVVKKYKNSKLQKRTHAMDV